MMKTHLPLTERHDALERLVPSPIGAARYLQILRNPCGEHVLRRVSTRLKFIAPITCRIRIGRASPQTTAPSLSVPG